MSYAVETRISFPLQVLMLKFGKASPGDDREKNNAIAIGESDASRGLFGWDAVHSS
jgi:hypothetical protein